MTDKAAVILLAVGGFILLFGGEYFVYLTYRFGGL
jgi:hypothetical protein